MTRRARLTPKMLELVREGFTIELSVDGAVRLLPPSAAAREGDDLAQRMDEVGGRSGHGAPALRH